MKIKSLTLYTTRLAEQKQFYATVLGVDLLDESKESVSFRIGDSVLKLINRRASTPYHFAINIPANKENEALEWLKERVTVLKDGKHEIQDFDFWNAKAVYFYDKDQNIVELIARKNLENQSDDPFDQQSFLEISEMGMPTDDIKSKFDLLHQLTGVTVFSGDFDRFCAIGGEHGLFICINKNIKDWFPTNDKAHSSDFEITIDVCEKRFRLSYQDDKLTALT